MEPTPTPSAEATVKDRNKSLFVILGSVLGSFLFALVLTFALFSFRRCIRRRRRFCLPQRTVTPLDDAEFESWRRPSEYSHRPNRFTIMPKQPEPLAASAFTHRESMGLQETCMVEKEIGLMQPSAPVSPTIRPLPPAYVAGNGSSPPTRHARRVSSHSRRKSSGVVSVRDRPPTPCSPASAGANAYRHLPQEGTALRAASPRSSTNMTRQGRQQQHRPRRQSAHLSSNSEASDFDFGFEKRIDAEMEDSKAYLSTSDDSTRAFLSV